MTEALENAIYSGVTFPMVAHRTGPCRFVFGIRKSGSSVLNSMVAALAQHQQQPYVDIAGTLFQAGVPVAQWQHDPALGALLRPGHVYGGFRNFPSGLSSQRLYRDAPKILLVRDPRDALVSEYFSNAYSHSVPLGGPAREQMLDLRREALSHSIDAQVLQRAPAMATTLREYLALAADPSVRVFRYEDVIGQKRRLLHDISSHFGWPADERFFNLVLSWADVMPTDEDPTRFVRKVAPGDHLDKLSMPVIAQITGLMAEEMRAFGYSDAV
jgi:hypothetical protein